MMMMSFCSTTTSNSKYIFVKCFQQTTSRRFRSSSSTSLAFGQRYYQPQRISQNAFLSSNTPSNKSTRQASATVSTITEQDSNNNCDDVIDPKTLLQNWRDHPSLQISITFPTWLIPSSSIQTLLNEPELQPYFPYTAIMASQNNENDTPLSDTALALQHIHPRIKIIQNSDVPTHKRLLRLPSAELPKSVTDILEQHGVTDGSDYHADIPYHRLSFSYILSRLLPLPPPTAYEHIGHLAHFNLKPELLPYGELIGQVLVDVNPTIHTVVTKVGEVSGPFRTYPLKVLAGRPETETVHGEHGITVALDVATCYWCTRLSGERQVLLEEVAPHSLVADVFCGVGALPLLANRDKNCTILANDWNPSAIEYFRTNIERNSLSHDDFQLSCGDAFDFLSSLGGLLDSDDDDDDTSKRLPDHVVMNFPLEAPKFLGSLRWWPSKDLEAHHKERQQLPRFHVYTFARADNGRTEEEVAVDLIAEELVPEFSNSGSYCRREELNDVYGSEVQTRIVRDVAPGKLVICVSFTLTPKLLRHIQGDFSG